MENSRVSLISGLKDSEFSLNQLCDLDYDTLNSLFIYVHIFIVRALLFTMQLKLNFLFTPTGDKQTTCHTFF